MKPPTQGCTSFSALPWLAKANAAVLCALATGLCVILWPLWMHDSNLTHGVFLPVLSGILLFESRRDPRPRFIRAGAWACAACVLLVLTCLASLAVAVVYAAALGWTHAVAEFMLACAFVSVLGAGLTAFADRRVRFVPLNWATAVAAAVWIFASQPPPGTYSRLALFLQGSVTSGVTHVLGAAGIAAYQVGNVIELAHTSVGVSEACSGVRSLISCEVAGLFLSALMVRGPWHRALLVVLTPAIGLAMNFLRSLLLTLLANSGVQIEGPWHDITGGSILVVTTLLVAALGLWLNRRESNPVANPSPESPAVGRSVLVSIVSSGLLVAAAAAAVLALSGHEDRAHARASAIPDLAALLPEAPAGWTADQPSLDQYSDVLHTHALVQRVYTKGAGAEAEHITLYLAYWLPGQAAVSLVDAHTPDACWPGTGWEAEDVPSERVSLAVGGRTLPPAECRRFAKGSFKTYVWFWHLHGGHPISYVDPYSAVRLLGIAWHYGFSPPKDQLFIRVSSNRAWREVASEPALARFFSNVEPLGL